MARLAAAVVIMAGSATGAVPSAVAPGVVVPVTLAYAVGASALDGWVRRRHLTGRSVRLEVLLDALALTVLVTVTGMSDSPWLLLVAVHLTGATLVLSYRVGLELALWYALTLTTGAALVRAGDVPGIAGADNPTNLLAVASVLLTLAAATAAFSAVNERELTRRGRWSEVAATLGLELAHASDPGGVCTTLADALGSLGFRRVAVVTAGAEPVGVIADGDRPVIVARSRPFELTELARVGASAVAGLRCWRASDSEAVPELDLLLGSPTNVVAVELWASGERRGWAVAEWGGVTERSVPAALLPVVAQVAERGAQGLAHRALIDRLRHQASRDQLTSLWNRGHLFDLLDREVARADRTGSPLGAVLLDVDHFKMVNDTFGHQRGDDVLVSVAAVLADELREPDVVGRYGGEEFLILLPGSDRDAALRVAERLRARIEAEVALEVTASAGVAVHPVDARGASALVGAADRALYAAKAAGRNRVVAAGGRRAPASRVG